VDEHVSYASDDRSSLELIEQEFALSRRRSRARRLEERDDRLLFVAYIAPAIAIVVVAIVLTGLILSVWPA
jgi:hypothetical protein